MKAKHGDVWRSPCGAVELRCGRWQDALADVDKVDAAITDPPYNEKELQRAGRYVFAPLPQVTTNRSVRLAGDGPATWTTWITVARPRSKEYARWGALPGAYVDGVGSRVAGEVRGAKQLPLMRAIVRDYSRPGDLVCDPCAGGATTLLASAMEGRRAIGAEMDPETFVKAVKRLEKGWTVDLFAGGGATPKAEQGEMF